MTLKTRTRDDGTMEIVPEMPEVPYTEAPMAGMRPEMPEVPYTEAPMAGMPELRPEMPQNTWQQNMDYVNAANSYNPMGAYFEANNGARRTALQNQINDMMGKAAEPRSKMERAADIGEGVWGGIAAPLLSIFGGTGAAEGAADYLKDANDSAKKRRDQYETRRNNSVSGLKTMMDMLEKSGPVSQTQLENMTNQMKMEREHEKALADIAKQQAERTAAQQKAEYEAKLHPLELERKHQDIYEADQKLIHGQTEENRKAAKFTEEQAGAPGRKIDSQLSQKLKQKQIDEYAVKKQNAESAKEKAVVDEMHAFTKSLPAEHMTPDEVTKAPLSIDFLVKKHGLTRAQALDQVANYWRSKVGDRKNKIDTELSQKLKQKQIDEYAVKQNAGAMGEFGPKTDG